MFVEVITEWLMEVLKVILPLVAAAATTAFLTWITSLAAKGLAWVREKVDDRYEWLVETAIQAGITAAEQMNLNPIKEELFKKKDYAMDIATQYLKARRVKVDLALLSGMMESAIWNTFNQYRADKNPSLPTDAA